MIEEVKKNKGRLLSNCILFFIILTFLTIIASAIGSLFGLQATYTQINPNTGSLEKYVIAIESMINSSGIRYIIGNAINNFITFVPLGYLLVAFIGIGVANKSGFLPTLFTVIGKYFNKYWLTFLVTILGILSNFGGDFGYIVLIPLSAILFLANNRNPIVGMVVSFVSITAGHGINLILSNVDYSLLSYTDLAGQLIDSDFKMSIFGNIFFTVISSFLLAFLISYITEKIVVPKIPKYKRDEQIIEEIEVGKKEKRGLILACISMLVIFLLFIYMLIPGLPYSGMLLDNSQSMYLGKLFGAGSLFESSLIYVTSITLLIAGLFYGIGVRSIKNIEQATNTLYQSLNNIGSILILIFFAAEFIAIFKRTNIGTVIIIWLANIIEMLKFSSLPAILLFFIFVGISGFFLTSTTVKWAIFSPVVIPLLMKSNITPEFTQAIFRVSDSATNILTPLLLYFVLFIGYVELYNNNEKTISIKDCYRMLWPYSIGIIALFLFIIIAWYIIRLPIGINAFPTV